MTTSYVMKHSSSYCRMSTQLSCFNTWTEETAGHLSPRYRVLLGRVVVLNGAKVSAESVILLISSLLCGWLWLEGTCCETWLWSWRLSRRLIKLRLCVQGACNVCVISSIHPQKVFRSLSLFTKESDCCRNSATTAILNRLSGAFFLISCLVLFVTDRLCCFTANAWYHNRFHGLVALRHSSWSCYSNWWSDGLFFCVCEHIEEMMGKRWFYNQSPTR